MRTEKEQLDNVEYILNAGNAVYTFELLKQAGGLLKGVDVTGLDKDSLNAGGDVLAVLLSNLSSPIVKSIQEFIYSNINVVLPDGKQFKLKDKLDEHFNEHPHHMIPLLVKGVKFQFSPFFTSLKPALAQIKM